MAGPMSELADQYLSNAHSYTQLGAQTFTRPEGDVHGYSPDQENDTITFLVATVLGLEDMVRRLASTCDALAAGGSTEP